MPKSNTPYDPQPEREDALGELARKGFQGVPGDHTTRLSSLQSKLDLPGESAPLPQATFRSIRPRRWFAVAAGIAALAVVGLALFNYDASNEQLAKVSTATDVRSEQQSTLLSHDDLRASNEVEELSSVHQEVQKQKEETLANTENFVAVKRDGGGSISNVPAHKAQALVTLDIPPKDVKGALATSESPQVKKAVKASTSGEKATVVEPPSATPPPQEPLEDDFDVETTSVAAVEQAEEVSHFRMERTAAVKTREISGEVIEPSGNPISGAVITIEETGQQVISDQKGEFAIVLSEDAIVGNVSAEGYPELIFDVTAGEEYRLFLPRIASSIPIAQLKGKSVGLRIIAPIGEVYGEFDAYVAKQLSEFTGEGVTIQFDVNRFGRPRNIVSGPGKQNREALKVLKGWLKNGPDWPEKYRRKAWRYKVTMP